MARPRLELLARHAAVLFVEVVTGSNGRNKSVNENRRSEIHPGAHLGVGEEAGLEKIVDSVNRVFRKIPKLKTRIAVETTAGQGSCLGHRFEQIAYIIQNVREPERLCVCLDTAHIFAAGYDI